MLFILHADHEQNCSTNAVRSVGSSQVDPYSAVAAGVGALYGPLHGGANEAVLRMLRRIGGKENIPDFIKGVKDGNEKLMGFGHRVYKNYDPRAKIIKKACDDVFEVTGVNPLLEIAQELEKIALEDEYFVKRKLYPNVDFYSGLIYEAFQFPPEMFTVLFAIGRTPGWLAQWLELVQDKEQKIARPKQVYTGDRDAGLRAGLGALGLSHTRGTFVTGASDVHLGDLDIGPREVDAEGLVPVWIAREQFNYSAHTHITIDVVPGRGAGFSIESRPAPIHHPLTHLHRRGDRRAGEAAGSLRPTAATRCATEGPAA